MSSGSGPESIRSARLDALGEIVVDVIDQVGNILTHKVRWCTVHVCPARVYGDGSIDCWHDEVVGWSPQEHEDDDIAPLGSQFVGW